MNQPSSARDWFGVALGQFRSGKSEDVADTCEQALKLYPADPNLLSLAARAYITMGMIDHARDRARAAVSASPRFAPALEVRGDVLLVEGAAAKALESYREAAETGPLNPSLKMKIARAEEQLSSQKGDVRRRRQNVTFEEELRRAADLERNGEFNDAEDIYRRILKQDPDQVEAIRLLAAAASRHRKYDEAEIFLKRAVELAPGYARAWADLCVLYCEQEKLDEALKCGQRVTEVAPDNAEAWISYGNACGRAGLAEEAIGHYRKAIELRPGHPSAYSGLAHQLKTVGRQDDAVAAHRECIAANPALAEPWWSLANLKTYRLTDSDIKTMEALLQSDRISGAGAVQLNNALGLAYEHHGDYNKAFGYFDACNRLRRNVETYDPVETETTTDRLIETFSAGFFDTHSGSGLKDDAPIFIVGLPRSGSTLIEQILASHSMVEGTHELSDLGWIVRSIRNRAGRRQRFPESVADFSAADWSQTGRDYIDRTRKFRNDLPRFIDKNPNNFIYIGLLALALPNARVINARRHPMDSCFGTWKQLFASGQPFSYDLTEVGEYYLQYHRLMEHWHQVLPGRVLDVHYENVVADLQTEVKRLLQYCDLPFENACIDFHKTDRAVKTASSEQVRQPIYSTSINLWKRYESHLDELADVLEPVLPGGDQVKTTI